MNQSLNHARRNLIAGLFHKDGRIFLALYRSDKLLVLNPDGKTLYITADRKLKRVIIP